MKKVIFTASLVLIFLIAVGFLFAEKEKTPTVAACPTFHYLLEELKDISEVNTVKSDSTGESLKMIENGEVDMIISGRALKEEEPRLLSQKIGDGYDFIFAEEVIILEEEMGFIPFYTDLSSEKIINDFSYISEENLSRVDNPYDYLKEGVVITSLEETLVGEVVHVLKSDGSRVRLSRLPRLYYSSDVKEEIVDIVTEIIKEN